MLEQNTVHTVQDGEHRIMDPVIIDIVVKDVSVKEMIMKRNDGDQK